ncbi:MAG: LysR family transcriptional regulator substrate-binding protein, partial [Myxococcota bacterium]
ANDPPPHLVGRRAGALEFAVYARSDLVERSKFDDLRDLPWVLFQESLRAVMTEEWVTERVGAKRIVARVDSVMMMRDLVRQGAGAAVLPCALGEEGLVQVTPALPGFSLDLWVLTHPNLRGNRRVKLALEHFSAALKRAESKLSANPV